MKGVAEDDIEMVELTDRRLLMKLGTLKWTENLFY